MMVKHESMLAQLGVAVVVTHMNPGCEMEIIHEENKDVNDIITTETISQKIHYWALNNITVLTNKCITELLAILRSEGHMDLPRRAETLLATAHTRRTCPMMSKRGVEGSFIYLGIEEALKKRVDDKFYKRTKIKVLINTDGIPLFNSSRKQFWPILVQVFDKDYYCVPAIVAIYLGDSKPSSIEEFLDDFVKEAVFLIENGVTIGSTHYGFEIAAFVCDTPARAYIKCCKAHNAFYGCERCVTRGLTEGKNKRVYPQMNAALRTHQTFKNQDQLAHHHQIYSSPLLQLPNFDIIRGVILDSMHLLCIGVMRSLFEKWFGIGKSKARVKRSQRKSLREILQKMKLSITCEFQRKELDLEDWVNWKATQFRFFLFYCGSLVSSIILSPERQQHFLLLCVACRILNSTENATRYTAYAKDLLRKFFFLLPTFYGNDTQTMNFHNLIHIADDVEYMQAPLSSFTAFPFENELGKIKKLIRAPKSPLVQTVNRLAELDALPGIVMQPIRAVRNVKFAKDSTEFCLMIEKIELNNFIVTSYRPNNLVLLNDGSIIRITKLSTAKKTEINLNDISIEGYLINVKGDAYDYPTKSSNIGIFKLGKRINSLVRRSGSEFCKKCIFMIIDKKKFAVTILH